MVLQALKETVDRLKVRNAELLNEKAAHNWVAMNDDQEGRDIIELQRQYIKEIEELKYVQAIDLKSFPYEHMVI